MIQYLIKYFLTDPHPNPLPRRGNKHQTNLILILTDPHPSTLPRRGNEHQTNLILILTTLTLALSQGEEMNIKQI